MLILSLSPQVVMVYNVATFWLDTVASYTQINALADKYAGQDLVILGFPCNQFGWVSNVGLVSAFSKNTLCCLVLYKPNAVSQIAE